MSHRHSLCHTAMTCPGRKFYPDGRVPGRFLYYICFIYGLKFTDESYSSIPGLHYFDQHGRCMILDPKSGSLEPSNIALLAILDLDDFELFQTADNDTFAKICDKIGIKRNERVMYYRWLVKHFGYGPDESQHPDSITFICPFTHNGMKGGMGKLVKPPPKFKVGTRFPIHAGKTWLCAILNL